MFGFRKSPKSEIAQRMSDDLKRKISEIHLKIQSGDLTPEQMELAYRELARIRGQLETKVVRACAARPAHP